MDKREQATAETPEEPKPGLHTSYVHIDMNSELGKFFMLNDGELIKKYDLGPIDDED